LADFAACQQEDDDENIILYIEDFSQAKKLRILTFNHVLGKVKARLESTKQWTDGIHKFVFR
jgi:hypothetical protein